MVLYLPRDTASVPVTRQVLDGCLQTLGVTPDTRADIALALSEACANVIQHAGPGDEYEVQASARNGQCAIEVVNTSSRNGKPAPDGAGTGPAEGAEDSQVAARSGRTATFQRRWRQQDAGRPGRRQESANRARAALTWRVTGRSGGWPAGARSTRCGGGGVQQLAQPPRPTWADQA